MRFDELAKIRKTEFWWLTGYGEQTKNVNNSTNIDPFDLT